MKPLHKGLLGLSFLAVAGASAFLVVQDRSAVAAPRIPQSKANEAVAAAPGAADSAPSSALPCTMGAPADKAVSVPEGLKATVRATPKGRVLTLAHTGHVIAIQAGSERRTGLSRVEQPVSGEKLTWETTDAKTLDTVRGELTFDAGGAPVLGGAVIPATLDDESAPTHACRATSDGASGFVVVCRVDGAAAAASVETKDPKEGVWSQIGSQTLVRFALPMTTEGADTKVIGMEKGGRGTLVRVEASRVAGEKEALLTIVSDGRSQPQPVRIFGCVCRMPPQGDPMF